MTIFLSLLLSLPLGEATKSPDPRAAEVPPNVVLIVADDLGYGEMLATSQAGVVEAIDGTRPLFELAAMHSSNPIPWPAADVVFSQAYVTAPNCSPSRAGLLSGLIPTRTGYEFNPIGARNEQPGVGLPPETITLAERLKAAGYATGLIGKWHLGGEASFHPFRQGFDEFFGFTHEGHFFRPHPDIAADGPDADGLDAGDTFTWLRRRRLPPGRPQRSHAQYEGEVWRSGNGRLWWSTHMRHDEPDYDANNPLVRGSQPVEEKEYLTDAFTREARSFIRRRAEQPFFLMVAYSAVHSPLQARADDVAAIEAMRFGPASEQPFAAASSEGDDADDRSAAMDPVQRRIFAGMFRSLMRGTTGVLAELEAAGLRDNTLVVFVSDNGGPTRELTSRNVPLRGGKSDMYEGGLRVPLRAWLPASLRETLPPRDAGRPLQIDAPISTLDLMPTVLQLVDEATGDPVLDFVPLTDGQPLQPLLAGEDPGTRSFYWRQGRRAAYREGDWKLVRNGRQPDSEWELFDLAGDRGETTNLAAEHPETVERLAEEWDRMNEQMSEPLFGLR